MGLAGLIAGALGGAAKGYTEVAETNLKKSDELDLKKQLMEAEADKKLAIDAITRQRDISDIGSRTQATAEANLAAAPISAQTDLVKGEAAARNRTTLAPLTAEAAMAEYKAGKPLKDIQTTDAIKAEIEKTTTLAGDENYLAGETKLSKAKGAATIEAQRLRNEGALTRATAGGGKAPKAETTADLQRIVTRAESDAARVMGVDKKDLNSAYARLEKKSDPASVALREKVKPHIDEIETTSARLKNWKAGVPQSTAQDKKPAGNRPSLNTFDLED